ncbi:MAG: hypothetical protein PUA56_05335 [Bacillales bacterium]|nr:hypothetical protein [Bacillales bacterium]
MNKQTHNRLIEGLDTLKNKGFEAFNKLQLANALEDEKKASRREYYAFKNKCESYIYSDFPISNKLVEPDGEIDTKALDYIMEIGMLVKIYQAGLLSEDMFLKVKTDVSKRYKIYSNVEF